jgi:hypothetical protein
MAEIKRFNNAHRALPITKALLIEALPVKSTNNALEALPIEALSTEALPVDTDTNEPAIPVETNESAVPVDISERNQLAVPSANATEPSTFTLETDEPSVEDTFTLEIGERAEPLVEDALTFNTLTSPPLPLRSIPATGFGQLHTLQRTNGSATPTYTSLLPPLLNSDDSKLYSEQEWVEREWAYWELKEWVHCEWGYWEWAYWEWTY